MEKEDLKTFRRIIAKKNFGHPIYLHDILEFIPIMGKYRIKGSEPHTLGLCKALDCTLDYIEGSKKYSIPHSFRMSFGNWIISLLKTFYKNQTGFEPNMLAYWWHPGDWKSRTRFIKSVIKGTENVIVYDGKCYRLFHQCIKSKK